MSAKLIFSDSQTNNDIINQETWKLLIVDDDKHVHDITKLTLKNLKFKNKNIIFTSCYSAQEAIDLLKESNIFSIILLDITMETANAGLDVAKFIRKDLKDNLTRIIVRTGQPGDIPEREIIDNYDINDFKSKTELTVEKLFISIRTALAQYDQINELDKLNKSLETRIDAALKKQKEQQEALFLSNRSHQMSELLNMLAHQWRQPLSRISAVTSQLKFSIELDEINKDDFYKQVDKIENYTSDLSKTIDEFRTVYEPEYMDPNTPLYEILSKSASIVKSTTKNLNINIICDKEEKLTNSASNLNQALINILKNSLEAIIENKVEKSLIEISVNKENCSFNIVVEDNAGGIDENIITKIFDPYFTTKEGRNGHGLGLYISKCLIEQQCNGTLNVSNIENGARFTITLENK